LGKQIQYKDCRSECWSRVRLDNGEQVWIGVNPASVIVKRRTHRFWMKTLYETTKADEVVKTACWLHAKVESYNAPVQLSNPVLKVFTQVALDSASTSDLEQRLFKRHELMKPFSNGDRRNAMRYQQIIADYSRYIEANPPSGKIRSASELPHSKEKILEAITFQIVREKKSANLKTLKLCALMLADYQEEGGLKQRVSTRLGGLDFLSDFSHEEETLIKRTTRIAYNNGREKAKSVRELVDDNLLQIENKLMVAEALRHKLMQVIG
jgi:hypothetical protein